MKIRCGNGDSKYLFRGEGRGNLFSPSTNELYHVTSACPWCPSQHLNKHLPKKCCAYQWSSYVLGTQWFTAFTLHIGILGLVMQSHYTPGQALRVPGSRCSQISRQLIHESGKVVSPMHRPPLLISVRGWVNPRAIQQMEELRQWSIRKTNKTEMKLNISL